MDDKEHPPQHGPTPPHGPRWADWSRPWRPDGCCDENNPRPPYPPWWGPRHAHRMWRHSGSRLFFRFLLAFGLLVLLGSALIGTLGAGALLLFQPRFPAGIALPLHLARGYIIPLLVVAIGLAIAFRSVGRLAARRLTMPLSAIMRAADSLADGNLAARVPVQGSAEFRQLAHSFNRMAAALETADRQRRALLADVAHELRTPLSVVQGNLEGLRDGVYEATPEHVDLVLDETHKLARLVDDLRLLTLAEAGQLPLDLQTLDVAQLLADVRETFALQAEEANVTLAVDAAPGLPSLRADPQRIGQVLDNLLANALRYTPAGGTVTLGAVPAPAAAGPALQLWVADTGRGIPAEDLPHIFDRFWRGDPARSHTDGTGSGLGLAIAKSLVEAHGGRIGAESRAGEGTTISFMLPI